MSGPCTSNAFALCARAGDSFTRTLTWTEDDGTPIDLTGASVEWSLRSRAGERQYVDAPQASITDAAGGVIELALTFAETRELAVGGLWSYEVTVEFAGGTRTTVLDGSFTVLREVVA